MNQHSLPTIGLASMMACIYLLQVACDACDHHGTLNSNDGAQVVSANSPGGTSQAIRQPTAAPAVPVFSTPEPRIASGDGPTREQVQRDAESYRRLAKMQGSRIGNGPDDLWLWQQAKFRLLRAASTIIVDVDQAVVTLRGTVPTKQDAEKAIAAVREIEGVRDVINQLAITNPQ